MIPEVLRLNVLLKGLPVGILQMTPDGKACVFEYDRQWLSGGFSLSPRELPLTPGLIYADPDLFGGAFALFEDCLPDGYGLYLLDRMLRREGSSIRELTPLQRLAILGDGGMGALSFQPSLNFGNRLDADIDDLDLLQQKALEVLSEKNDVDTDLLYYRSGNSGGARPKVLVQAEDGSHWLVKFRHTYDPSDIGRNEYLYMQTAKACGIETPRIKLLKDRYFAVERFDIGPDGRRHVATAAALLKVDFRRMGTDYTNLLALTGFLTQDPRQVEEMFRRMVFNIVSLNKDDHAKNFSFICEEGIWRLAPAYDLTYSPAGTRGEHATSLFYKGNPGLDDVMKAGMGIRIPENRCLQIIKETEEACESELPVIQRLTAGALTSPPPAR